MKTAPAALLNLLTELTTVHTASISNMNRPLEAEEINAHIATYNVAFEAAAELIFGDAGALLDNALRSEILDQMQRGNIQSARYALLQHLNALYGAQQ